MPAPKSHVVSSLPSEQSAEKIMTKEHLKMRHGYFFCKQSTLKVNPPLKVHCTQVKKQSEGCVGRGTVKNAFFSSFPWKKQIKFIPLKVRIIVFHIPVFPSHLCLSPTHCLPSEHFHSPRRQNTPVGRAVIGNIFPGKY